jgi:hypothetical protein
MKRLLSIPTALLAVSLPMMLGACASSGALPPPLRVDVPAECERVLAEVAPPRAKAGDDIRVVTARGAVVIREANHRIRAGRDCVAGQRQRYGGAQ